jgi:hypothetical protein
LDFEVNADGHVTAASRDTFFNSVAGGYAIYIVPFLDMVIYKMASVQSGSNEFRHAAQLLRLG